jgi:hypothetical protein
MTRVRLANPQRQVGSESLDTAARYGSHCCTRPSIYAGAKYRQMLLLRGMQDAERIASV